MPHIRAAVKHFKHAPLSSINGLICSEFHEIRMFAVLLLVKKYSSARTQEKEQLFAVYLHQRQYVNNWDLVDCSAHLIVGPHLQHTSRVLLSELARSESLWERRIAIIATYHFIKQKQFDETLQLAELLLNDHEDLIHKAVGWMLREVANRDKTPRLFFCNNTTNVCPEPCSGMLSKNSRKQNVSNIYLAQRDKSRHSNNVGLTDCLRLLDFQANVFWANQADNAPI